MTDDPATNPAARTDHEKWGDEQETRAEEFIKRTSEIWRKVQALPGDVEEMQRDTLLARVEDALPLSIGEGLDPDQHKSAYLAGKGMPFAEIEGRMNLDPGSIEEWHQQDPRFRKAFEYYKSLKEEELGTRILREADILLDSGRLSDDLLIKLMELLRKVGLSPHQRMMDKVNARLKYEQVQVSREVGMRDVGRLPGVPRVEAMEGDFEVIDDGGDKDEDGGEEMEEV